MKQTLSRLAILIVAVALAGGGGYWFGLKHSDKPDPDEAATAPTTEEDKPVAEVTTAVLKMEPITETATVYGTITAEPGNVKSVSVPFECKVMKIPVTPGAPVEKDAALVDVEASPDALVALQDAKNALAAATNDLKQTEQRLSDHLATNQELATAKQTLQSAQLKLDSMTQRGIGESHTLKAEAAGLISKIDVQEGQIVPAGTPLVEIADASRIQAQLGVQPEDAGNLKAGQTIKLRGVNQSADDAVDGKILLVSQRVDPATRLVNVSVALPPDSHFMLESFITAELVKASANALVVPRDAALPEEDGGYSVYTVKDGHAVKHAVHIGIQNEKSVQVMADDLHEGDTVVITGNAQLEDGMDVSVKEPGKDSDDKADAKDGDTKPTTTQAEAKS